jgi:hypothetical protein
MSVDKINVDIMTAGKMTVDKITVDKMIADKMIVDKMTVDKMTKYGMIVGKMTSCQHIFLRACMLLELHRYDIQSADC